MSLENLRKRVIYQNTLEVWIGACQEKNIQWDDLRQYKKFISFLKNENLPMKPFSLCISESEKEEPKKIQFAESLSKSNDPDHGTFTIKLNDSAIELIRKFDFGN